jgi:purine-binding chemotaxis protein CheW
MQQRCSSFICSLANGAKHHGVSEKWFADAPCIYIYISLIYIRALVVLSSMEGGMTRAIENDRFLLCRIGTRVGALALRDIQETMRPLPVEPLAGAPLFVLGIAILRGSPTPVIDVERLMGSTTSTIGRFVTLKLGARTVALAVGAVLDVRSLPLQTLSQVPKLLGEASATLVLALGSLDAELLMVLEASHAVPETVWASIEAPRLSA